MLIIKEFGPGVYIGSKAFPRTKEGYAEAMSEIERINSVGHYTKDDDSGAVKQYFGA